MAKVKIVTDSSVQLTPEEVVKYDITVVPLTIEIDGETYVDGKDITREGFMEKMARAQNLPKTSQPSIGTFIDTFDELAKDGSQVLAIHMTETLSGTVNAARQAANISRADIVVEDSYFTDRALAFQVLAAAKMAQTGATREEIITKIHQIRDHTHLYMFVSDLTNLVKGGRLSRMSGVISSILKINLVVTLDKSKLEAASKGRGTKTLTRFIDKEIQVMKQYKKIVGLGISHADGLENSQRLLQKLKNEFTDLPPVLVRLTSPVIATHTGAGAYCLMYYTE